MKQRRPPPPPPPPSSAPSCGLAIPRYSLGRRGWVTSFISNVTRACSGEAGLIRGFVSHRVMRTRQLFGFFYITAMLSSKCVCACARAGRRCCFFSLCKDAFPGAIQIADKKWNSDFIFISTCRKIYKTWLLSTFCFCKSVPKSSSSRRCMSTPHNRNHKDKRDTLPPLLSFPSS